jgi:hypothetical protein
MSLLKANPPGAISIGSKESQGGEEGGREGGRKRGREGGREGHAPV